MSIRTTLSTFLKDVTGSARKQLEANLTVAEADADRLQAKLNAALEQAEADAVKAAAQANTTLHAVLETASQQAHLDVTAARSNLGEKIKDASPEVRKAVDDALVALEGKIILALA